MFLLPVYLHLLVLFSLYFFVFAVPLHTNKFVLIYNKVQSRLPRLHLVISWALNVKNKAPYAVKAIS